MEYIVILPVLLFLILGSIQLGFIYQAKSTVNYATLLAAREGALQYGDHGKMRQAFASGLAPLFAQEASLPGLTSARIKAAAESTNVYTTLEVLNPTPEAMQDFGVTRLDGGMQREIPNDTLMYRKTNAGGSSGISVQDANILKIRITYCYRLFVPVADRVIHNLVNSVTPFSSYLQANGMHAYYGEGDVVIASSCTAAWALGQRRIPVQSEAIVRMQTPYREEHGF